MAALTLSKNPNDFLATDPGILTYFWQRTAYCSLHSSKHLAGLKILKNCVSFSFSLSPSCVSWPPLLPLLTPGGETERPGVPLLLPPHFHQPRRSTFKGFATHSSPAGDNKSLKIEVNATARGKRLKTDKSGLEIVSDFLILVLMETFSTSLRCPSKAEFRCYTSIFDGFILYSFGRWDRLATITAVKYERLSLLDQ